MLGMRVSLMLTSFDHVNIGWPNHELPVSGPALL